MKLPLTQDKPEIITEEVGGGGSVYSNGHYYEHSPSICGYFGCGKEMSLEESRRGKVCFRHYGEQSSGGALMRVWEQNKNLQK